MKCLNSAFISALILTVSLSAFATDHTLPPGTIRAEPFPQPYATGRVRLNDQINLAHLAGEIGARFIMSVMAKEVGIPAQDHLILSGPVACTSREADLGKYGWSSFVCSADLKSKFSRFHADFEISMSATMNGLRDQRRLGTRLPSEADVELVNDNSNDCQAQLQITNTINGKSIVSRSCETW
jgi:hypothetical protein